MQSVFQLEHDFLASRSRRMLEHGHLQHAEVTTALRFSLVFHLCDGAVVVLKNPCETHSALIAERLGGLLIGLCLRFMIVAKRHLVGILGA